MGLWRDMHREGVKRANDWGKKMGLNNNDQTCSKAEELA